MTVNEKRNEINSFPVRGRGVSLGNNMSPGHITAPSITLDKPENNLEATI